MRQAVVRRLILLFLLVTGLTAHVLAEDPARGIEASATTEAVSGAATATPAAPLVELGAIEIGTAAGDGQLPECPRPHAPLHEAAAPDASRSVSDDRLLGVLPDALIDGQAYAQALPAATRTTSHCAIDTGGAQRCTLLCVSRT
ncbi:hypothetical protein GCM10010472_30540 [Pseudonocardia halophobica]|uniref:Uncharacterized protein n=1 Tax=Pseudonocardia halophobica TaxID=29401 RepID=A0A9W6NU75_9PSEU|nr:hypothetical protein [Pseudonocardia halophobica]GLL09313.1 hypothetical protein GCM10017577_04530 [Pseudonocardia halophobica]